MALTPGLLLGLGLSAAFGAVAFSALGVIMGNLGDSEGAVSAWNNLVTFPLLFLTETFYSLETAPAWIQVVRDALPFNHYLTLTRHLAEGALAGAWPYALITLGFGAVFLAGAILTFRWDSGQSLWTWPSSLSKRRLVP
jgi:ABC-2 type transport system permease protein